MLIVVLSTLMHHFASIIIRALGAEQQEGPAGFMLLADGPPPAELDQFNTSQLKPLELDSAGSASMGTS